MSSLKPAWLCRRPIAHRGLHCAAKGLIENSIAAAHAAIVSDYAIECDVQQSKDDQYVVFHDDRFERLTEQTGRLCDLNLDDICQISLGKTSEKIPSLQRFLSAINSQTPLFVELKSRFDGNIKPAKDLAAILKEYPGPVAIESFDPILIGYLRRNQHAFNISHILLGIVAQGHYDKTEWPHISEELKDSMTHFLHYRDTLPDFISWRADDFPHAIPYLLREITQCPITTWTVRSYEEQLKVKPWANQIVFEDFLPD